MKTILEIKQGLEFKGLPTRDAILEFIKRKGKDSLDYHKLYVIYDLGENNLLLSESYFICNSSEKDFRIISLVNNLALNDKQE